MILKKKQPRPFSHFPADCKATMGTFQAKLYLKLGPGLSRMTAWLDCTPGSPDLATLQEGTEAGCGSHT